jgi:hypothetical protein
VADLNKILLGPLAALIRADGRLNDAIDRTRRFWLRGGVCWIDQINEPTELLRKHKIGETPHGHS